MSGIAGIWHLDGRSVDRAVLHSMTRSIAHRGPDAVDHWHDGSVGLGHVMLRTVPEAEYESQPVVSEDGQVVLTMDGRIDNRSDLLQRLALPETFLSRPDSDFVLAAYEKWGVEMTRQLLGDFALALWDARRGHLMIARDHFGVRPLYFVHRPGRVFAFASEIKALRAAELVSGEVNDLKVAEFLLLPVSVDPAQTFWKGVSAVLPAHQITVHKGAETVQRAYWALDPRKELRLSSDAEYEDRFKKLFFEAVRCRMRSSRPVGAMLSGGMDSTSIACVAAQILEEDGAPLHTFSGVFEEVTDSDESPYIEAALRRYPETMKPFLYSSDRLPAEGSPLAVNARSTWYLDRPDEGINGYMRWGIYKAAQQKNIRVLLDGFDGDTTVSHAEGYFHELLWAKKWLALREEVKATVELFGGREEHWQRAFRGWIKHYFRRHPVFGRMLNTLRRSSGSADANDVLRTSTATGKWVGTAWRKFIQDSFANKALDMASASDGARVWKSTRDYHHMMLMRPVMQSILRDFDARGAEFSVETRFPFFDVRLVEFCLAIPGNQKRRNGWTRWIMRRAMEGVLPSEVQWRTDKADLSHGLAANLARYDSRRLRSFIEDICRKKLLDPYLKTNKIEEIVRRFVGGNGRGGKNAREIVVLTRAVALFHWLSDEEHPRNIESLDATTIQRPLQRRLYFTSQS